MTFVAVAEPLGIDASPISAAPAVSACRAKIARKQLWRFIGRPPARIGEHGGTNAFAVTTDEAFVS